MEQDTLAHLIGLFAQLGGEAKWAFLAYLVFKAFIAILISGVILAVVTMIFKGIRAINDDINAYLNICTIVGGYHYEHASVLERIREMKAKSGGRA